MYTVYKHTTPSGKIYIGITKQKVSYRWNHGNGYKGNKYFYRAIEKYGWDNIKHEILFTKLTKQEAEQIEINLIAQYKSNNRNYGYNSASGGNVNVGFHLSEEAREKIRTSKLADRNPMYGKSSWNKGKHLSEETKQKISGAEKTMSEEAKRRISESLKGEKSPLRKPVVNVDTGEIFPAISVASEKTNIPRMCICNACKGVQKTAGGFHWRYFE